MYKSHSIYKLVLEIPSQSQNNASWLCFLRVVYQARSQMRFPVLEILLEFEEEDQRIMGFVLSYSPF